MLPREKLTRALSQAALVVVYGPWSRIVGFRHLLGPPPGLSGPPQPLWGGAAKLYGARFTPKGAFDSIYLASDPITALLEVQALVLLPGGPLALRTSPWAIVTIDGLVSNVLDLTNPATLTALGTNEQELSGTWVTLTNPPTQLLALAAWRSARIAGIKYRSAKHPGNGLNLVVFPDRLSVSPNDYLEVYDPYGHLAQRIGN
jgi:RES domain-containing protein